MTRLDRRALSAVDSTYSSVRAAAFAHPDLRLTAVDNGGPDRHYFLASDQICLARPGVPSIKPAPPTPASPRAGLALPR